MGLKKIISRRERSPNWEIPFMSGMLRRRAILLRLPDCGRRYWPGRNQDIEWLLKRGMLSIKRQRMSRTQSMNIIRITPKALDYLRR